MVAATNQQSLHRLSSGKQLKELTQVSTPTRWVQRLASIGDTVCGVARGEAQDTVVFYNGNDLTRITETEVDGRITWDRTRSVIASSPIRKRRDLWRLIPRENPFGSRPFARWRWWVLPLPMNRIG